MAINKFDKMARFMPSLYKPRTNTIVRGLLTAWSEEDDKIVQAAKDAKEQIFVLSSQLQFLDAMGSNVGVFRPTAFNLADALYRQLIPTLSFRPKQIIPTIERVLDIFFGADNDRVLVNEIRPNEIEIQIPSSIPALRRTLRGSHHFHNYSGTISSIDNTFKEMVIDIDGDLKELVEDEFQDALFGAGNQASIIISNTAGNSGVTLQFSPSEDLSKYSLGQSFLVAVGGYPGSFIPDETALYSKTASRGILGQAITAGQVIPNLLMQDASNIPDTPGLLAFNIGHNNEEAQIKYFGRPNNSTLLLDPSYNFQFDHVIGEAVNVIAKPYVSPNSDGSDLSIYIVGVTAARILAQEIIRSIAAAGVVINFTIVGPVIDC
jgi:hypothetical protein